MTRIKRTLIILCVLLVCVGCDQVTKTVAKQRLPKSGVIRLLNDTLRLQYTENPGAFLSFGANISEKERYWVFTLSAGFFLSGMLIYLFMTRNLNQNQTIALSLVLGGGLGNLIDRIFNEGRVVDFMNIGIGSLRTGVFNVADIAITLGIIWFLFISVRSGNNG